MRKIFSKFRRTPQPIGPREPGQTQSDVEKGGGGGDTDAERGGSSSASTGKVSKKVRKRARRHTHAKALYNCVMIVLACSTFPCSTKGLTMRTLHNRIEFIRLFKISYEFI